MPHRLLHLTIASGLIIAAPFAASATEDPLPAWEKLAPDMNDAFSGLGTPEAADGDDNVWIKGTFDSAGEDTDKADEIDLGLQSPPAKD